MSQKREIITNPFFPIRVEEIKTIDSGIVVPRKAVINADTGKIISVTSLDYQVVETGKFIEDFEDYLRGDNVKFVRSHAWCNPTGRHFEARYRFPEIKVNFGERETNFGKVPDDVELTINVFGSYDGSTKHGFELGGFRLMCLNGMRRFEKLYRWAARHIGQEDLADLLLINFDTAREIFINQLAPSWEALTEQAFDTHIAADIVRKLELSKLYRQKLGLIWQAKKQLNQLQTMWDFYNLLTAFTTHYVEGRNMLLARQIGRQSDAMLVAKQ